MTKDDAEKIAKQVLGRAMGKAAVAARLMAAEPSAELMTGQEALIAFAESIEEAVDEECS